MQNDVFVWYTEQMKKLSQANKDIEYIIHSISGSDQSIISKLNQVGFIEGEKITFLRAAPIFKDPILYKVGASQIALTKLEASCINITEQEG